MQDLPGLEDLVRSVAVFLAEEVVPAAADERLRFRARVAANVLAVVGRQLCLEEEQLIDERGRLIDLYPREGDTVSPASTTEYRLEVSDLTAKLAADVRNGRLEPRPGDPVWRHVRETLLEKLAIANPAYLERVARNRPEASG